jgi:hypothetical protein
MNEILNEYTNKQQEINQFEYNSPNSMRKR